MSTPNYKGKLYLINLIKVVSWLYCFTRINNNSQIYLSELALLLELKPNNHYLIGMALKLIYEDKLIKNGKSNPSYNIEINENSSNIEGGIIYNLMEFFLGVYKNGRH